MVKLQNYIMNAKEVGSYRINFAENFCRFTLQFVILLFIFASPQQQRQIRGQPSEYCVF
jgi:hypothetical protein